MQRACPSVRLFVCLSPNCKNAIFSKTKQFRGVVSILFTRLRCDIRALTLCSLQIVFTITITVIPIIHTVCVVVGGVRAAAFTLTLFAGGGFHAMRQRLQSELNHLSAEDP